MRELDVMTAAILEASRAIGVREARAKETETGAFDVVTDSDLAAEEVIIDAIRREFPRDEIVSEETGPDAVVGGRSWAVDPIDGTMNFVRGIPVYGTQAVFMSDGDPRASAIHLLPDDRMFTASAEGAFMDGEPISVSEPRPLRECILTTGDYSRRSETFREAQAMLLAGCRDDVARIRMLGAACADFAYLASGRTDIHIRFVNRIWDFMPGMFLAERAGAVYDRDLFENRRILVLCSCREVLDEALAEIVPKFISCFRRP